MKKILITGGGSGLGFELSKAYAKENNHLILVGRSKEKLEVAVSTITDKGGVADYIVCDITDIKSIDLLKSTLQMKYHAIDCLINNAGIGYFGPIEELSLDELDQMLSLNVKGTILMTQTLLPLINEKIINIISTAGLKGKINEAAYVASKFAVRGFTESLQKELSIKVTAVYMGGMATPFWDHSTHIKDKSRLKDPSDVAKEILAKDDGRLEIIIE
ncbi:MAG: SDR family NAD(P)-dependent oxidoreductase [Clostridiales bacterium]|nr:SDR family NAD(P)-dependent oxidoreductase [Clostridiales bacterium]